MVTNYNTALSKASEGTFRTVWGGGLFVIFVGKF